jgi:hypothetical protein
MTAELTGMSTAAPSVTSAMLGPQRNSQKKRERRNGRQTPHTVLLYLCGQECGHYDFLQNFSADRRPGVQSYSWLPTV